MKRRLYSVPALLVLLFVTVIFIRGTYVVFTKKAASAQYVESLSAQQVSLNQEETQLTANIASLKTESGLEKEVKEKYNVAKDGEHVVILVDSNASTSSDATSTLPWYKKMWNAIIGSL